MLIVYDERCAEHLRGVPHPESPQRVEAVAAHLRERGDLRDALPARDATDAEIELVHSEGYVNLVEREVASLRASAGYLSTGDTIVDGASLDAARRAAGAAIAGAQAAYEGNGAAFAIVRPPGHHAESTRGMGFCVFNNAAIAARTLQAQTGARTLIVDFDYHHGNGTQAVAGDGLSYVSTHGYPAYPGTGGPDENYALPNEDAIVNVPLPPHGFGTEPFVALWKRLLPQIAARVKPDMLIVSAGFDYVQGDPVGDLGVAVSAAADLAAIVNAAAQSFCDGRVLYVLEGGYDIGALAASVAHVIDAHRASSPVPDADAATIPQTQQALLRRILT